MKKIKGQTHSDEPAPLKLSFFYKKSNFSKAFQLFSRQYTQTVQPPIQ
jgi:hypothetical protein